MHELKPGIYLVATPIGNLDDLSARARQVLQVADLVCAEDTRNYRHLLQVAQIHPGVQKVISLHAHNEAEQIADVLQSAKEGARIAVVTDAGTPCIADPGQRLIDAAWESNISIFPIPGPSAVTAALSVSGFAAQEGQPISFWGFLPARSHERKKRLQAIQEAGGVSVVFESPHRILQSLEDSMQVLGPECPAVLIKEMTKRFEHKWRGSIASVIASYTREKTEDAKRLKGEFVIVFKPRLPQNAESLITPQDWTPWVSAIKEHVPKSTAAKILAQATGISRQDAYLIALGHSGRSEDEPGQQDS